jgi:hypothetical protein
MSRSTGGCGFCVLYFVATSMTPLIVAAKASRIEAEVCRKANYSK